MTAAFGDEAASSMSLLPPIEVRAALSTALLYTRVNFNFLRRPPAVVRNDELGSPSRLPAALSVPHPSVHYLV